MRRGRARSIPYGLDPKQRLLWARLKVSPIITLSGRYVQLCAARRLVGNGLAILNEEETILTRRCQAAWDNHQCDLRHGHEGRHFTATTDTILLHEEGWELEEE